MAIKRTFATPQEALAWAAECQLATVEALMGMARPRKFDLHRHQDIAETLVEACRMHVTHRQARDARCHRVADSLVTPPGVSP